MKAIIYFCVAALITGCASDQASVSRWNDMWLDIALRHKYEKYSCAHALEGYAKDPPMRVAMRRAAPREQGTVKPTSNDAQTQAEIRELSARIDVLEDALKTNSGTINQNQTLIVDQIKALKAKLEQVQK
jgi:hypothetical protein